MPAWVAPATWVNGTLTATFANAEVRDHLVWLKAALDLITNSTAADSGTGTQLRIARASASDVILSALVTGDVVSRLWLTADGSMAFGAGPGARDVLISRGAAGRFEVSSNGVATTASMRAVSVVGQEARVEAVVSGDVAVRARMAGGAGGVTGLYFGPGSGGPTKVVGERITGYVAFTGSGNRGTTYDPTTVTLPQLAARVKSLQDDLMTHGLIGT